MWRWAILAGGIVAVCGSLRAVTSSTNAVAAARAEGAASVSATAPSGPYQDIPSRNAFGLKTPPPPAPPPEEGPVVTPSALKLTGITTLLGPKKAMFVLAEPGKPQIQSEMLGEHEQDGSISNLEVLQIDERAGAVRVKYGNKELTLDFANNGLKPGPIQAPPAGAPGRPGLAPPPQPTVFNLGNGLRNIPSRPNRLQPQASGDGYNRLQPVVPAATPQPAYGGAPAYVGQPTMGGASPGVVTGVQAVNQPASEPNQVIGLSPYQQQLIMAAQQQHAQQQGIPMPPMPPMSTPGR